MSRRFALWLVGASLSILVGLAFVWWSRADRGKAEHDATAADAEPAKTVLEGAILYFPSALGTLVAEERPLPRANPDERLHLLVEALLAGPRRPGLAAPFPETVRLGGAHVGSDAVAYVDLHAADGGAPPPAGSLQERLMVYSVVDTVALGLDTVDQVVLLWNGTQRGSLSGHLDTSVPLDPDLSLIAGES